MTVAGIATSPLSELEHRVQLRRAVIASTIGTTIEVISTTATRSAQP